MLSPWMLSWLIEDRQRMASVGRLLATFTAPLPPWGVRAGISTLQAHLGFLCHPSSSPLPLGHSAGLSSHGVLEDEVGFVTHASFKTFPGDCFNSVLVRFWDLTLIPRCSLFSSDKEDLQTPRGSLLTPHFSFLTQV